MSGRDCDCCAGLGPSTPRRVENRPGLSTVDYRAGRYPDFRASLLAALSRADRPALGRLRTRATDDFTIALLDGFAIVCDLVTFGGERLAQEAYLRTATERGSLGELGRLVGYRVRPGVAAQTHLAFHLAAPRPVTPQAITDPARQPAATDRVALPAGVQVRSVPGPGEQPQTFETVESVEARPAWSALHPAATRPAVPGPGATELVLAGTGASLRRGDVLLFLDRDGGTVRRWTTRTAATVTVEADRQRTRVTFAALADGPYPQVHVLRQRLSVFGHNAPLWTSMSRDFRRDYTAPSMVEVATKHVGSPSDELTEKLTGKNNWPDYDASHETGCVDVEGAHSDAVPGGLTVLLTPRGSGLYEVTGVRELSRAEFAISGKVTRLTLHALVAGAPEPSTVDVRETVVGTVDDPLPLAEEDDPSAVRGGEIVVDGAVTDLPVGRTLLVASPGGVEVVALDRAEVAQTNADGTVRRTRLLLADELAGSYPRATVTVFGNVARATHGETVHEILGSGDATVPSPRFGLRQAPLTYVPSTDPSGAAGTVRLLVNDVEWHEVPSLYQVGPGERVFVTEATERGTVDVVLGDGRRGARPPTGQSNLRAIYRKGIGAGGNVPAGALSQPIAPPLGVDGVTNPAAAEGGADPQPADEARSAIPLAVRTLGRAVSIADYADFARSFAGVAKAQASVLNLAGGRTIAVTVAAAGGAPVPQAARDRLAAALRTYGDPTARVVVLGHRTGYFRLALSVKVDPDYGRDAVLTAVEQALRSAFGFAARDFGQPVYASEVLAVASRPAGVVAIDLDALYRDMPAPRRPLADLLATAPRRPALWTALRDEITDIRIDLGGRPHRAALDLRAALERRRLPSLAPPPRRPVLAQRLLAGRPSVVDGAPVAAELLLLADGALDRLTEMT